MSGNRQQFPGVLEALVKQNLGFWLSFLDSDTNLSLKLYFPKLEENKKFQYSDDPELNSEYEKKARIRHRFLTENNKAAKDTNFKKNMGNMGFRTFRDRENHKHTSSKKDNGERVSNLSGGYFNSKAFIIFNHSYESDGITHCYRPTHLGNGLKVSMVPNPGEETVRIINKTSELTKITLETQKRQNRLKKEATREKKETDKKQDTEVKIEFSQNVCSPPDQIDEITLKNEVSETTLIPALTEVCIICSRSTVKLVNLGDHKCCRSCKTAYYRAVVKLHEHIIDITETQTTLPDLATET